MARCNAFVKKKSSPEKTPADRARAVPYTEAEVAEKIPIVRLSRIIDPQFHERIIYESYKPANLREMQDFMHFMMAFRRILPNQVLSSVHSYNDNETDGNAPKSAKDGEVVRPTYPKALPYNAITVDDILGSPEVSKEIKEYYNSEIQTKLPEQLGSFIALMFI